MPRNLFVYAFLFVAITIEAETPAYLLLSKGNPNSTSENLLTANRAVNWVFDEVLSSPVDTLQNLRGVLHRSLRLALFQLPLDYMPMIIQHEAFGHGTRLLEAGYQSYAIGLQPPWPIGGGHGYTIGTEPPTDVSLDESLAIAGAGMDANDLFARALRLRWVVDGQLNHHQALIYLLNAGNRPIYVLRSPRGSGSLSSSGDVTNLIAMLNIRNEGASLSGRPLDGEDLYYRTLPSLVDPFAIIAMAAIVKDYAIEGRKQRPMPMASIGKFGLLPLLRTGFAPFGPEYYFECFMVREDKVFVATWRQSDPEMESAYGLGLMYRNMIRGKTWALDARSEFWHQPTLQLKGNWHEQLQSAPRKSEPGMGLWVTLRWREHRGLLLEAGGKSQGYVQGEPLASGLMVRGGLSFKWPNL